jgi:hypothetical protein
MQVMAYVVRIDEPLKSTSRPAWLAICPWRSLAAAVFMVVLLAFLVATPLRAQQLDGDPSWVTTASLLPAWGFYANSEPYGGTDPLGEFAAMGKGRLNWVANFPDSGEYAAWVRL